MLMARRRHYADTSLRVRAKVGGWDEINRFDETLESARAASKARGKVRLWLLEHRNGWLKARAEAKELLRLNRECGEAVNACEFERVRVVGGAVQLKMARTQHLRQPASRSRRRTTMARWSQHLAAAQRGDGPT